MKKEEEKYLARCIEYQQVKVEYQHPTRFLNPFPIPEWKWEVISLDVIRGLLRTKGQHDSIMAVALTLSKEKHFISV